MLGRVETVAGSEKSVESWTLSPVRGISGQWPFVVLP